MVTGAITQKRKSAMWGATSRGQFSCVMAGCCALVWLVGSLSIGQGSLADLWTKPHCPSGQAQSTQQSHHHCVWHCDGIDEQAASGQGGTSANLDSGNVWNELAAVPCAVLAQAQIVPRGPPALSISR